ncbi:dihydrofolate reductase [Bauldia sp.]|uniref:dihydrofolate reductase n=1 Tax=Bauldia sp. TaxID=2575872 RepID=UPI003BA9B91E
MTKRPLVAIIAAVADNGVIGVDGRLPWRLSTDMKRFRQLTIGKPVIMGRKTFESIGKPLAGRRNVVMTTRPENRPSGTETAGSLAAALSLAGDDADDVTEVMIIGGAAVYAEAMKAADRLYITHVKASPAGDVVFPAIDPTDWQETTSEDVPAGERDTAATRFVVYDRAPPAGP